MDSPSRRQTRQRQLILEALSATRLHPTADWVFEQVRRRLPRVSLGTVYRNLQVLEEEGRIRALRFLGRTTRYDADLSDHYHFVCDRCGAVDDLEKPRDGDRRLASLMEGRGYRVTGHRLEFRGLCPPCQRGEGASQETTRSTRGKELDHDQARRIQDAR